MKNKYQFKKVFSHLSDEEKSEIENIVKENGKEIDDLIVERKTFASEVKQDEMDDAERWAVKYVSTRDIDSIGDVVIPKGVILTEFKRSGMPFFWGHDISQPPLGSDEWVRTDAMGVKVKSVYADTGEGTIANIVWNLVKQGHQKQSSVGLVILDAVVKGSREFDVLDRELAKQWPEYKKNRKSSRRIITKSIMFEHSDVGIGMNNNTDVVEVSKMWRDEGADDDILKQVGLLEGVEVEEAIVEEKELVDLNAKPEIPKETEEVVEVVEEVEEKEEKSKKPEKPVKPVKRYAKVIKSPTYLKVLSKPQTDIQEVIDREVRKKLGKVV